MGEPSGRSATQSQRLGGGLLRKSTQRSLTVWRKKLEHMSIQTSATCTMCAQENIGRSGTAVLQAQCSAPRPGSACSRTRLSVVEGRKGRALSCKMGEKV